MDDAWTIIRFVNVFLYGGILTGLIWRWRSLTVAGWPAFRWGMWGFVAASAYATAEVLWRGVPGGPRLIAIGIPLLILFVGCYLPPLRRRLRKEDQ